MDIAGGSTGNPGPSTRQPAAAPVNLRSSQTAGGGNDDTTPAAAGGSGRRHHQPQSCNLETLYHEALPATVDRALSHSGPPALGGLGKFLIVYF